MKLLILILLKLIITNDYEKLNKFKTILSSVKSCFNSIHLNYKIDKYFIEIEKFIILKSNDNNRWVVFKNYMDSLIIDLLSNSCKYSLKKTCKKLLKDYNRESLSLFNFKSPVLNEHDTNIWIYSIFKDINYIPFYYKNKSWFNNLKIQKNFNLIQEKELKIYFKKTNKIINRNEFKDNIFINIYDYILPIKDQNNLEIDEFEIFDIKKI